MATATATAALSVTFEEADFLMHCIENWVDKDEPNFLGYDGEVMLTYEQIENLWRRIQEQKFN